MKKLRSYKRKVKLCVSRLKKELRLTQPECARCGECCGPVQTTWPEARAIGRSLTKRGLWPAVAKRMLEQERADNRLECPLLTYDGKTAGCLVYNSRPIVCRVFGHHTDTPCKNITVRYQPSKFFFQYMDLLVQENVYVREALMDMITEADREAFGGVDMDSVDQQQEMEERIMSKNNDKKKLVTGDKMKDADEELAKTKEKVVNDQ